MTSLVALISPVVPEAAVPTPKLSNCTSLPVSNDKEALAVAPVSKTKLEPSPTIKPPLVTAKPATSCNCASNLALATVPLARLLAFKAVNAEPFAAGSVAGNLASGTVPEVS